jgi:hypothetical protein
MASVRHLGLFPWCVNEEISYFKGTDIAEYAVPMWWRVKRWSLETTYTIFAGFADPPVSETYSSSNIFNIPSVYQSETDLITAGSLPGTTIKIPSDFTFGFVLQGFLLDGALVLGPNFAFSADAQDMEGISTSGQYGQRGSLSVSYCGLEFIAPLKLDAPDFETLYDLTNMDATLTATEYWPYDPGDGKGPIYDSATGEQLRGFPS